MGAATGRFRLAERRGPRLADDAGLAGGVGREPGAYSVVGRTRENARVLLPARPQLLSHRSRITKDPPWALPRHDPRQAALRLHPIWEAKLGIRLRANSAAVQRFS